MKSCQTPFPCIASRPGWFYVFEDKLLTSHMLIHVASTWCSSQWKNSREKQQIIIKVSGMAPKTKATKACLANLNKAPKTSTAKLLCPGDIRDHYHLNQANVDHMSDSLEPRDFFDVLGDEGLGCRSDLPDSDAEEAPEICEDDALLWFSQFLSKAQEDAAKGERSR